MLFPGVGWVEQRVSLMAVCPQSLLGPRVVDSGTMEVAVHFWVWPCTSWRQKLHHLKTNRSKLGSHNKEVGRWQLFCSPQPVNPNIRWPWGYTTHFFSHLQAIGNPDWCTLSGSQSADPVRDWVDCALQGSGPFWRKSLSRSGRLVSPSWNVEATCVLCCCSADCMEIIKVTLCDLQQRTELR